MKRKHLKPLICWAVVDDNYNIKEILGELEVHKDLDSVVSSIRGYKYAGIDNLFVLKVIIKEVKNV